MATIQEINKAVADQLYAEAQHNPQSPYVGKKVGIANGKVVILADAWSVVARALEQAEPDASRTFCIDMAQDYKTVQEIWEIG
jgi:hypothetical protein